METPALSTRALLWQPIADRVARLGAADPSRRRFGANAHGYRLRPPLSSQRVEEIERASNVRLPDDYRDFVTTVGDGGAGPAYGLWPLDDPRQLAQLGGECQLGAGAVVDEWRGVVALGHLGCGYVAVLALTGPHRGQVWIDAAQLGVVAPIAPHFVAYYTGWLSALEEARWPETYVPAGACAMAAGISGYLGVVERRLGLEPGSISGQALRDALGALGPSSICLQSERASTGLLPAGVLVEPCLACEQLLEALAEHGLARSAVGPPAPPR